ncbi:MAG: NADPH-dependent FMN reductase [Alphaproteobacteria bacterium 62-8]|nr:MAG: NADPH-dependent FMN reductase [Alphaproteobacteria bacterium 62-8]
MTHIIGIAGSLRRHSFNLGLLRAAEAVMPPGATLDVRTMHGIPLYNADEENAVGLPEAVTQLKDAVANADGLLLATPEYNNGIPGVFKNAIDWLSRPASDIGRIFGNRPVAIMGTSPGNFGTLLAQNDWLPVLRTLGARPWFGGRFIAPRAQSLFDGEGRLNDAATRDRLAAFMTGFVQFIEGVNK